MIKKTLYHVYYPLLKILHDWYRLKYHSAQEAIVNQETQTDMFAFTLFKNDIVSMLLLYQYLQLG